jgi:hypothetical protein
MVRKLLIIGLVASVALNAVLLYRVLNLGVAASYGEDESTFRAMQITAAEKLLLGFSKSSSRENLLELAKTHNLEVVEKSDGRIYVGNISFAFSGNRVSAVNFHE